MNYKEYVKKRLKDFGEDEIYITEHAQIRMNQRQLNIDEVMENIINPKRLDYAIREIITQSYEKYDCYFGYSRTLCHRYVIRIKKNVVVITAIKINRRWQRLIEKKLRKRK